MAVNPASEDTQLGWRGAGIGAVAYLFAVLGGTMTMLVLAALSSGDFSVFGGLVFIIPLMAAFALPGFVVLRLALHYLHLGSLAAFAFGGALNGLAVALVIRSPSPHDWDWGDWILLAAFVASGAVSGHVYRLTERALWREAQGTLRDTKTSGRA